ncbi:hypothetical protein EYZ11_002430 [Aspergillus tanneri]|uniref:Metallo-beta-lactamase domain-containing protein n=1 Tax=Aspergillus tanneri TaxID=1220188 RepID=A0A4S3JSV0_9EURO|nr:hypothetical protein EYZ11_002430 [Aspergillus tanneri]
MHLQGTTTYIVGTWKSRLLIDTGQMGMPCTLTSIITSDGEAVWTNHIRQVLADLNITLSHVYLIHWHSDHTGGVPDLFAHRPECTAWIYKCDLDRNQKVITDRDVFRVEGVTVRAIFSSDHAHDHI